MHLFTSGKPLSAQWHDQQTVRISVRVQICGGNWNKMPIKRLHSVSCCTKKVKRVQVSAAFGKNWHLLPLRWEGASRLLSEKGAKGGHQCPWHGRLHMCEGTIDGEVDVGILERYMLPLRWRLFPGGSWLFQQDDVRPHSARFPTAWLHTQRVCVLDRPACSPHLYSIENAWSIMKRRIRQQQPRTVEQLKSWIQQKWTQIPLKNCNDQCPQFQKH